MLVTSGPGATNMVTPLTDALMDSIPLVCITGQVPTHLIGNDAFQECDTVGITRPCTKHNWLVRDVNDLASVLHEAFYVATTGRPGPGRGRHPEGRAVRHRHLSSAAQGVRRGTPAITPRVKGDRGRDPQRRRADGERRAPGDLYAAAASSIPGPRPASCCASWSTSTGFPITSTLMGLGAYPASGKNWLGMLGMHGTYEANMAMHDCDVMICVGARFDDRITGRIDAFSPGSKKIHIDIDPSSINKNIRVDVPIVGDAGKVLGGHAASSSKAEVGKPKPRRSRRGGSRSRTGARAIRSSYRKNERRHHAAIRDPAPVSRRRADKDVYITTEVGQHQMWAAQFFGFEEPNRWMTSGGLGTMGYGLPAAIGVQVAHPDSLVIDIAGDASVLMTMQEMSTAVQYELPIKIFILNNQYMGMVRQWQQLLHGNRLSHSYTESLPDFVKLAEAYGCVGLQADQAGRSRRRDQGDDQGQAAGAVRLPRRHAGKLLPDDPVRQGA